MLKLYALLLGDETDKPGGKVEVVEASGEFKLNQGDVAGMLAQWHSGGPGSMSLEPGSTPSTPAAKLIHW